MSAKHTPGPWTVFDNPEGLPVVDSQHGVVAHVRMHQSASGPEVDANARLIAAAPELLERCERFVRLSDAMAREWSQGDWRAVLKCVRDQTEEMRAAIAKARGES